MLVMLSKNRQSPKFTPRQYLILYGIIKGMFVFNAINYYIITLYM